MAPDDPRVTAISDVVRGIPAGQVLAYGDVAAEAGLPGRARLVGAVLREAEGLPWWRVVRASGRPADAVAADQLRRLAAEGVRVVDGRVLVGRALPGR